MTQPNAPVSPVAAAWARMEAASRRFYRASTAPAETQEKEQPIAAIAADRPAPSDRRAALFHEPPLIDAATLPPVDQPNPPRAIDAVIVPPATIHPPLPSSVQSSAAVMAEAGLEEESINWATIDPVMRTVMVEEVNDLVPAIETGLQALMHGDRTQRDEVHRQVHTLKSVVAMAGALGARARIHAIESALEDAENPGARDWQPVTLAWSRVQGILDQLRAGPPAAPSSDVKDLPKSESSDVTPAPMATRAALRIAAEVIDAALASAWTAQHAGWQQAAALREMGDRLRDIERQRRRMESALRSWATAARAMVPEDANADPLGLARYSEIEAMRQRVLDMASELSGQTGALRQRVMQQQAASSGQQRAIHQVQEHLRLARRVPADDINDRLYRVVWQAGHDLGKSVQFMLTGGRTLVDRDLLQRLVAPIEHVLRNAVAHGIESAKMRAARGKPVHGSLSIAFAAGPDRLSVVIEDDGSGLDESRIRAKAEEKGWRQPGDPWTSEDAVEMICRPGFSTAATVNEVAGRGVGMDVVRNEILRLGGAFHLRSRPGRGLTLSMSIPTAEAVVPVLLVQHSGRVWALPAEAVGQVVRLSAEAWTEATATGRWRGLEFHSLLRGWGLPDATRGLVLEITSPDGVWLLGVPALTPVHYVNVQHLGDIWTGARGVLGVVMLDTGGLAPLIDVQRWSAPGPAAPAHDSAWALVVDDSPVARLAAREVVSGLGLRVEEAHDGTEALTVLRTRLPDLMTLDMEMPHMDGLACLRALRAMPGGDRVPVVMVTSRSAERWRAAAAELGVIAYLNKPLDAQELERAWRSLHHAARGAGQS